MISFEKARRPRLVNPNAVPTYELADSFVRRFSNTYRVAIANIKTPAALRDIARAIRNKSLIAVDQIIPVYDPSLPDVAARWSQAVEDFEEKYRSLVLQSGKKELGRLSIPMAFSLQNPYSLPWIQNQAGGLIREISAQTRQNIVNMLRSSFVEGLTPQQLSRLIRSEIGLLTREAALVERRLAASLQQGIPSKQASMLSERYAAKLLNDRAERIARTETIAAEAQGQLAAWRVARDRGLIVRGSRRIWISGPEGAGVCPVCSVLDNVTVGMDEPWQSARGPINAPPLHPNCLPGDAYVAPGGAVAGYSCRPFQGDLIAIATARGHNVAVTPNHPVLTQRGFIAAANLRVGENVFSSIPRDWKQAVHNQHKNIPARIHELANALGMAGGGAATVQVPVTAADFHGDAQDGQIAVISAYGLLRRRLAAQALQVLGQAALICGAKAAHALESLGTQQKRLRGYAPTAHSLMGLMGQACALLGIGFGHTCEHGFAAVTGGQAGFAQAIDYGGPRYPHLRSQSFNRSASLIAGQQQTHVHRALKAADGDAVLAQDIANGALARAARLSQGVYGSPGLIALDKIVRINHRFFSGHVYNLQCAQGAYIAEGVAVSNCRCTVAVLPPED